MDKLVVCFVSQGSSTLASHRMRVLKPAELFNVGVDNIEARVSVRAIKDADVNIFNKHFTQKENFLELRGGKSQGSKTIFDVCDDHFERENGDYYKAMCMEADTITCNSENMKKRIKEITQRDAIVIPDPITFNEGEIYYRHPERDENRYIWYGHGSNAEALVPWLDKVDSKVLCISDAHIRHDNVDYVPWKPRVVEKFILDADIVLLPTTKHPWTKCKSPNRVVDAIYSGKFVIADNKEVYGEFKDFIYLIDSPEEIPKAIKFYNDNPTKVVEMISKGKKYVSKRYSDGVILDGWLKALQNVGVVKSFKEVSNG